MFIVTVRLRWAGKLTVESGHDLRGAVEAAARPSDGLEHVYVQTGPPAAGIVLFLLARDLAGAEATAARLVRQAGAGFCGKWEIHSCEAELLVPFTEAALPPDE
ncbi:MAG TPA: hypothetical protein VJT31_09340 [Rugosimonospora sp.]|nr:hypothetical protein [Rugosimonospora sp.]